MSAKQETGAAPPGQPTVEEASNPDDVAYRVLATRRASTLEHELNEAALSGYRFLAATWGAPSGLVPFPGDCNETMVLVGREGAPEGFSYRVVPAGNEAPLEAELNEAGAQGFRVRAVARRMIILERHQTVVGALQYRVVTTTRVATLEAEIAEAVKAGYEVAGMRPPYMVEGLVAILSRPRGVPAPTTAP
jgi:hypothetical protein